MALNIKDPATDRLARDLAAATGESITVAVRVAMEERLRRVRAVDSARRIDDVFEQIVERGRTRRALDDRSVDEIIGYDEIGVPA